MLNNYIWYLKLNILNWLIIILIILIRVAFITLLERKILGFIQGRKGPNKVGVLGIFQPFGDAVKLFNKEIFKILKSNIYIIYVCSILLIFIILINWLMIPVFTNLYYINYSLLIIIIFLTIMRYIFILIGWSSNSIYAIVGTIRVVAQVLSYEVRFILITLILIILIERCSLIDFIKWQENVWFIFTLFPLFLVFFIRILAELNRRPIDFIEGESELISGFNIEYSRGGFALIIIAEYGIIIFLSYLTLILFTNIINRIWISLWLNFIVRVIISMRGLLPRIRYDELIYLCWKIILPFVLNYIFFILNFKYLTRILSYEKLIENCYFFNMFSKHNLSSRSLILVFKI